MNLLQQSITDISELIPQKSPFVMVDSLEYFSKNELIAALTIRSDNIFCKNKMFTESGLIENMAQTVALHTGYDFFIKNEKAPTGYIGSVKKAEIYQLPKLGEVITTKATILHEFMGVTMVSINVFNTEGDKIASSEMKTVIAS
jgi:predicted hotdog family 3-hydroxylacyl-ACP dehydratase